MTYNKNMSAETCKQCGSLINFDPKEFLCLTSRGRKDQWKIFKFGFQNIIDMVEENDHEPSLETGEKILAYVQAQAGLLKEMLNDSNKSEG